MTKEITLARAILDAMAESMREDPSVILMGEDIRFGFWGTTNPEMAQEFGDRMIPTPISENGFVSAGLGAALTGLRPVVELMFGDFLMLAMDGVADQAAKYAYQNGPEFKAPMVIRAAGSGIGAGVGLQHASYPEAWLMNMPGVVIVAPSSPSDAKALMKASIRSDSVVIYVEYKMLYGLRGTIDETPVELGKAKVVREGSDLSIVTYGCCTQKCIEAAKQLAAEGMDVEIIDLRTLKPFDKEAILASVKKTGHLFTVEDCCLTGGVGAEISAFVAEHAMGFLDGPIIRLAGEDSSLPAGREHEAMMVPSVDEIIAKIKNNL